MFKKDINIKPFEKKIYLASPLMHGEELKYMKHAYDTNWMSTLGENVDEVERLASTCSGKKYAVALCNCTSALHLAIKLAGEKLYGKAKTSHGVLENKHVFCSDMTFAATLNPVVYEGGIPIFIDTDPLSWNMDPKALEKAFSLYPDTKLVVYAELYGFPGRTDIIKEICDKHNAILIEDAAEAMGAKVYNKPCGSFGDISAISYNGNKIITGSSGGCLLTDDKEIADHARKLSTQARDKAPWYEHTEIGYNYRMSNVIAGVVRGQYPYIDEHIRLKKDIYLRYKEGLKDLPIKMNPIVEGTSPNYWLSSLIIDKEYISKETRTEFEYSYTKESNKTCPMEILETLSSYNIESRPIWKPMHLEPIYKDNIFISLENNNDNSKDIFERGLCLPSDINMTIEEQDIIIELIKGCFK